MPGPLISTRPEKATSATLARVRFPPAPAKVPRLSSLGGGFGPDSAAPNFACRGDGNCSVEKKSSPYILQPKDPSPSPGGQAKSRKIFRLCRNARDFDFCDLSGRCTFHEVHFRGSFAHPWGSCSRTNTRLLRVELVVPAPTKLRFLPVVPTPTVLHFGEDFGPRPRLFVVEKKVRPPAPVALLWRLAESVERFLTRPSGGKWRRSCPTTSHEVWVEERGCPPGVSAERSAECGVRGE